MTKRGCILLVFIGIASALSAQAPRKPLSDNSLSAWLEFIRPSKDELSYEAIGWRPSFWPAVKEARKLGRPILLWTMNGHPLGCT